MKRSISPEADRQQAERARSARGDTTHAAESQYLADNRSQTIVQRQLIDAIDASPRMTAQRERVESLQPDSQAAAQWTPHGQRDAQTTQFAGLQRKAITMGADDWYPRANVGPVGEGVASTLSRAGRDAGAPLGKGIRHRAETALGVELGGVRVHTGRASQDAAAAVRARAYTVGQDIHFGSGFYRPGSADGERLIAHELVHTVQQRGSRGGGLQPSLEVSAPGDHHEREADALASHITAGPARTARAGLAGGPTALPVTQIARTIQLTPLSDAEAQYLIDTDKDKFITAFETCYTPVKLDDHTAWTYEEVSGLWTILATLPDKDVLTLRKITKTIYEQFFRGTEFDSKIGGNVPEGVGYAVPYVKDKQEQMVGLGFDASGVPSATMHEVGHTVDYSNGIMKAHMADAAFGNWREEGTESQLDTSLSALTPEKLSDLKKYGSEPGNPAPYANKNLDKHTHGGRVYILPYKGDEWGWTLQTTWYSYDKTARAKSAQCMKDGGYYAFRSPIEWFAEAYQAYYTDVSLTDATATSAKPRHGGGQLRQANKAAAEKIDDIEPT
jgi:hypothetical protein